MRTRAEIAKRFVIKGTDAFGFRRAVLADYVYAEDLRAVGVEVESIDWRKPLDLDPQKILTEMASYMEFAWGKVCDHRGISASRSVSKFCEWLWILGDDELSALCLDESRYPQYGAPILKAICDRYGFPVPDSDLIARMIQGLPCTPECCMGCGQ